MTDNRGLKTRRRAYRNGENDFLVAGQISNVAVEGDALLGCTSLAHSQGHAQDGVSTKFS